MSRPIALSRGSWWIPALLFLSTAAVADEEWAMQAADCLHTVDGFNERREWVHYRITQDEVRVLVQSDRAIGCSWNWFADRVAGSLKDRAALSM